MDDKKIKLRVFIAADAAERIQDHVVELPGETPCVDVKEEAHKALARKLGTVSFKVTGVNLYPHWDKRRHGNGAA